MRMYVFVHMVSDGGGFVSVRSGRWSGVEADATLLGCFGSGCWMHLAVGVAAGLISDPYR